MRKPPRALVVTVTIPFLAACVGTLAQPLPEPGARPTGSLRGVILQGPEPERVEYSEMADVQWTDSTVALTGIVRGRGTDMSTRTYRLAEVESLLVRTFDPNRTSLLVAGVMVGAGALAAILFTGRTTDQTTF